MSRKETNFMLTRVPSEIPECPACASPEDKDMLETSPQAFNDFAMRLAQRGYSDHIIAHCMLTWASMAAEKAIAWSKAYKEKGRE